MSTSWNAPSRLRFRVFGDSLAAGVGCDHPTQAIGPLLATALRAAGHEVDLLVAAVSGARSADLAGQIGRTPGGVDLALVVIGANDLTSLTPPAVGARLLQDAVTDLRARGARVVVAPAPDLSVVTHVPPAYRPIVAAVSEGYARAQTEAVTRAGGTTAVLGGLRARFAAEPALFSGDRFHPSAAGYAVIAGALAPALLDAVGGPARD